MIKATDLIKKVNALKIDSMLHTNLSDACKHVAYYALELDKKSVPPAINAISRINKLATRFEREFLRANKKSKFIILHGTDIKEMDILTWNTGCDVPYYENAVFESKEEANRFAELEEMDDFTIVEVLNEN